MSMPAQHTPEYAQLEALRQMLNWAEIPEDPDGPEMQQFMAEGKAALEALSVKLKTGNLTRTADADQESPS